MTDFEDFTFGTELVVDDVADYPDWTDAAQVVGGGGGGGYASLTGAGQTVTPGELDQAGPFTVTSDSGHVVALIDQVVSAVAHSIQFGTPGRFNVGALSVSVSANSVNFSVNPGNVQFDTIANTIVNTGGFIARQSAQIQYGIAGAGAGSLPGIVLNNLGVSTSVGMHVYGGNPNGVFVPPTGTNAICFDTATPALWAWKPPGPWVNI